MRLYPYMVVILLLASNTSAECRDKECMPDTYEHSDGGSAITFYYDSVFQIGSNWFIIFEYDSGYSEDTISFEFGEGPSKTVKVQGEGEFIGMIEESISFPGSSFANEEFHKKLFINFTQSNGEEGKLLELKIHINKPPAEDLIFLWGGMTVFWLSIGLYVLYISNKFRELSDKIGVENNGAREKN
jgi:hypothetical protein